MNQKYIVVVDLRMYHAENNKHICASTKEKINLKFSYMKPRGNFVRIVAEIQSKKKLTHYTKHIFLIFSIFLLYNNDYLELYVIY